jgi:hypothetical protein
LGVAWLTAVILDDLQPNIHLQYSYSHQLFLVEGNYGSKDDWLGLQESFPANVLIAIGLAQSMLPNEGLDFLVGWHNSHEVPDELVYYYTSALQNLIVKADNVSLFQLENIRTDYLIDSAIQDATNKSKLSTILDYLEQRPEFMAEFKDELPIIRLALDAPAPSWYFSDSQADGLSPDGEWVRFINIDGSANIKYYNLETGVEFILPSTPHHWSPEYTDIVFQDSHLIKIFNLQSGQVQEYQIGDGVLVGWKDNSHLWIAESVQTESGQKNELRVLSLNGGDITPMGGSPKIAEAFISGPGGKIAWIQEHEVGVGVFDRDQLYFFQYPYAEYEYINLFDWTPGGSGLVLTLYETLCIQRLDGSIEKLSLQRSEYFASYPRFYAWRNENEFYWCYKVGYHDMLALYNISNKRTTLSGIFNVTAVAGNRALATGGDGKVYVYDLRN